MENQEFSKNRPMSLTSEEEDVLTRDKKKIKNTRHDYSGHSCNPISYANLEILQHEDTDVGKMPRNFKESLTGIKSNDEVPLTEISI